jgi:archaeosine-15-forming tRNA-guanine transglycosylase
LDKNSTLGDFSKSNTHSKNAQVTISAEVQTSVKHGKSTFFKIFLNKKMWEIKLPFTSKNPFVI